MTVIEDFFMNQAAAGIRKRIVFLKLRVCVCGVRIHIERPQLV
jgi:hypothetical protein